MSLKMKKVVLMLLSVTVVKNDKILQTSFHLKNIHRVKGMFHNAECMSMQKTKAITKQTWRIGLP